MNKDKHTPRIAISGKSGCGNTTVSKLVGSLLGLRFINFTFRTLAQEKGLSLEEVLKRAETDDSWDKEVDERQVELAQAADGCVLGSRLAIWVLKSADLRVYLKASGETRAARIHKREGGDLEAVARFTAELDAHDSSRYKHLYSIDNNDYHFADLIIDTDTLTPQQIAELIVKTLKEKERC